MLDPQSFLARLTSRKVGRWALAYLAGSWLILQALDILIQNFDLPHVLFRVVLVLLAAGLLALLVIAWYHGEKGAQRVTGLEVMVLAAIVLLAGGAAGFLATRSEKPRATAPAPGLVDEASIAVLPFLDMSPKHDQEYFSDGLTEEILNVLAQIPGLRVAARTSSFAFKGKEVEVDSIGRALRVAHVLEGSVRTDAPRVRITAQLIDARSGYHVWSETYDRDIKDVFAVQGDISNAIAGQLRLTLQEHAAGPAVKAAPVAPTADPEAHALLLQGIHFARVGKREELAHAVKLIRQALRRDARFARAHAELGAAYQRQSYLRFIPREEGYGMAEAEARRALQLDARDYRAHELLGRIADYRRWDFKTAENEFRLALESNPSDATTHSHRAWMLMRLRRTDEALTEAERASELDPISGGMTSNLAAMYLYAGQLDRAARTFEAAVALEPTDVGSIANLAMTYGIAGRLQEAVSTAEQALAHAGDDDFVTASTAYVYARAGRRDGALRLLARLERNPDSSPYLQGAIHLALGDTERAWRLLQKAVDARDDYAGDVAVDPLYAELHGDPRFQRMLVKAGLS